MKPTYREIRVVNNELARAKSRLEFLKLMAVAKHPITTEMMGRALSAVDYWQTYLEALKHEARKCEGK